MQAVHDKELSKAKIRLMEKKDSVFFTTLAFSMKHVWDSKTRTAAAYAKSKTIKWNPAFFMDLADAEERIFLMLHEVMHIAYLHMGRLGNKDRKLWNIACDHVINLQLMARGFKMPTGKNKGYADPRFVDMSAEEVYKILLEEKQSGGGGGGSDGAGGAGDEPWHDDLEDAPEDITEEVERQVQDILVKAALRSKMENDRPGTVPGDIEDFLGKLLNPKLPWQRILQKQFQAFAKNDYSWKKPNRRHFPRHYLPSLHSESLINLDVYTDASSSTSDDDWARIVTETHALMRMGTPEQMNLIQFTTEIKSVSKIRTMLDLKKINFRAYGGTDIGPVIDRINETRPQCALIFTDGEFDWPGTATNVPVVWLIYNNPGFTAPFGAVVHYEP